MKLATSALSGCLLKAIERLEKPLDSKTKVQVGMEAGVCWGVITGDSANEVSPSPRFARPGNRSMTQLKCYQKHSP